MNLQGAKRICLFSTFVSSVERDLSPQIRHYLSRLHADSKIKSVLIDTSPEPKNIEGFRAEPWFAGYIHRHNVGLDFASWASAMTEAAKQKPDFDLLILANDSVIGPLFSIDFFLERIERSPAPTLGGITQSLESAPHLQSYFLVANKSLLHSPTWRSFWRGVKSYRAKESTIAFSEIELSRVLASAGTKLEPLVPHSELAKRTNYYFPELDNPCVHQWDILLKARLSPFIKKSIFDTKRLDHKTAPPYAGWKREIEEYPFALLPPEESAPTTVLGRMEDLEFKLNEIRGSWTMKVGKALYRPLKLIRTAK